MFSLSIFHHLFLLLSSLSQFFFTTSLPLYLTTRLELLIMDELCFSHPCSAVFIFYFELLWPLEPHRPLCSQHHPFSKSSLSFHPLTPSLWLPRAQLSWSLSSSCPCSQGVDRSGLQLFPWYTVLWYIPHWGLKMKEFYYYSSDKSRVLELSCGIRWGCNILSVIIVWGIEDRQKRLKLRKILAFLVTSSKQKFSIYYIYVSVFSKKVILVCFFCARQERVTHSVWWSWVTIGCRRTLSTKTSTQSGTRSSLCEWLLQYPNVCMHTHIQFAFTAGMKIKIEFLNWNVPLN